MSTRRYEPEWALAVLFQAYLDSVLDADLLAACPAVTFYDPMAQDDDNRIVVLPHQVETLETGAANFVATVEVTLKTRTHQPTLAADLATHFERVNAVRGALCVTTLADDLEALPTSAGLGINFVDRTRKFSTNVTEGWIFSETILDVKCFAKD